MKKSFILTIFGITGDLSRSKLLPALYTLFLNNQLGSDFAIIGYGRRSYTTPQEFSEFHNEYLHLHPHSNHSPETLATFFNYIQYHQGELTAPSDFASLKDRLEKTFDSSAQRIFYFALPPEHYSSVSALLHASGCNRPDDKLIIEKPFGHDRDSAEALESSLHAAFDESQIYRIDHFLGKSAVQNLLAFRFASGIFEPLWNRDHIDSLQLTVAESAGIGTRGGYYDTTGAIRDMVQNHCLELLTHVTMDAPASSSADDFRRARIAALESYTVSNSVTGQYRGYLEEDNVRANSSTETFAALELTINAPRWHNVPVYIRTGKKLHQKVSELSIHFKQPPTDLFTTNIPNILTIRIQPTAGIALQFAVKSKKTFAPQTMTFCEPTDTDHPDAYGQLLLDCLAGDKTFFIHRDEVMAAWDVIDPITKRLSAQTPFPYDSESWGPDEATQLIQKAGRQWTIQHFDSCAS